MMKDLIIFGASGFGREVAWLVERINKISPTWNLQGFMDDDDSIQGSEINGYRVLGKLGDIRRYQDTYFVCAVGSSRIREKIINRMEEVDPESAGCLRGIHERMRTAGSFRGCEKRKEWISR